MLHFMFPEPDRHAHPIDFSSASELASRASVPFQFVIPIVLPRFGANIALRTSMPKAPIYENSDPLAVKSEVWLAGK